MGRPKTPEQLSRRAFLERLALSTGAIALMPVITACGGPETKKDSMVPTKNAVTAAVEAPPNVQPAGWDAIAYNKTRGNAGAIPQGYRASINGEGGDKKHLGKHLPYLPKTDGLTIPEGYVALMWGDAEKGFARHPNSAQDPEKKKGGHWYDWIRVRSAVEGDAQEVENTYPKWPGADAGQFVAFGGGDITAEGGKNTVYLAKLPDGVKAGDPIRVWAHCLKHGEYVDFLTVA